MNNDENDTSNDLTSLTIGPYKCNVNRAEDNILLLNYFDETIPYYDQENGLHLKIKTKKNGIAIVPLNKNITNDMLIDGAKKMSDDEYYNTFVQNKTEFLKENLLKNTYAKGFQTPSAVQAISMTDIIQGRDTMIQFKSGSGKTHAFLFSCLWSFDPNDNFLQHIFITSSHEVAEQIFIHAKYLLGTSAKVALCIGHKQKPATSTGGFKDNNSGDKTVVQKSLREELEEIMSAQVLVCTMGKLYNLYCDKKKIDTKYLKTICVDEFDTIVVPVGKTNQKSSMSCMASTEEQMAAIIRKIPEHTRRIFFSATVSSDSFDTVQNYFRKAEIDANPLIVLLDSDDYTLDEIKQYYVMSSNNEEKRAILIDLIKQLPLSQAIIYANSKNTANEIRKELLNQMIPIKSGLIHGDLTDSDRRAIVKDFRDGAMRILISTDLTARGFDVQSVNIVLNYDMPDRLETYIHRVGRSGRYNRKGTAISLILHREVQKISDINNCSKSKMVELPQDLNSL